VVVEMVNDTESKKKGGGAAVAVTLLAVGGAAAALYFLTRPAKAEQPGGGGIPPQVTISASPPNPQQSAVVSYSGRLTDKDGNGIAGAQIAFQLSPMNATGPFSTVFGLVTNTNGGWAHIASYNAVGFIYARVSYAGNAAAGIPAAVSPAVRLDIQPTGGGGGSFTRPLDSVGQYRVSVDWPLNGEFVVERLVGSWVKGGSGGAAKLYIAVGGQSIVATDCIPFANIGSFDVKPNVRATKIQFVAIPLVCGAAVPGYIDELHLVATLRTP
jgi:hypothetical protein